MPAPSAPATRSALPALRAATGAAHRRLDGALDIVNRLADPEARPALLGAYRGLFTAIEQAVAPHLHAMPGVELAARRRADTIEASAHPVPPLQMAGPAAALGALYVAEGATLGGRTIRETLAARGSSLDGLGFLDPYGAERGRMWRALVAVLERELGGDPVRLGLAIEGALAGFALAEQVLAPARAPRA